ncbi:carbon-nitrogen hydrolase family protein [Lentzea sp. JNUCC 0626]|uniref:carbon-nitrogen hydrolase family protein n=1 Tax=Lentzea sp. JNUCC 0626 TaxID=3367513 RepID=UPI0037487566
MRAAARNAAEAGARLLITAEVSLTGYHLGPRRLRQLAEPGDGAMCTEVAEIAAEEGIAIVFGWPELADGNVYNSVRMVEKTGETLATYRKTHLFGDIDRAIFEPGQTPVVQAQLDGLTVGMLICYDVEFPETVRAHALAGTELLVVPTALMKPWEIVAQTLVHARALENQIYLAYVNWSGSERELDYCGLTRVVGPSGFALHDEVHGEQLVLADLDPMRIWKAKQVNDYVADRRPDLYGSLSTDPA